MEDKQLIELAFKAQENAYAPYSNYHVGACLLCKDGTIFYGANVENASFGATNCAERNALFAAYSNGYRADDIDKLAIVSDGKYIAWPCGICRQVIVELMNPETPILLSNRLEEQKVKVCELLPSSFGPKDLL